VTRDENCLSEQVIEENIAETGRRGRRRSKQLLDGLRETRRYWKY